MRHGRRQQMAQHAAKDRADKKERSWALISGLAAFCFAGVFAFGGYQLFVHPDTPLPREWNPMQPLAISDPVTRVTDWKLNRAAADFETCVATLEGSSVLQVLSPLQDNDQCYINDRVALRGVGDARLAPIETRCAIALRVAMWEEHSLQPAAQSHLGTSVTQINHIGSYNCRQMRSVSGTSTRMSTHATADAIDISGFGLANGDRVQLQRDWTPPGPKADFLRDVRDGACDWFDLTLSPDFNRLHADHFHLQSKGWGSCR